MKQSHAYKSYSSTYIVKVFKSFNPELQLKETESSIRNKLIDFLTGLKGFKLMTTFILEFRKIEIDNKIKYNTFYSNSKAEIFINEKDTDNVFESVYTTLISNIQKYLGKGRGYVTD